MVVEIVVIRYVMVEMRSFAIYIERDRVRVRGDQVLCFNVYFS